MSSAKPEQAVIETELAVLRALCQGADGKPLWNDAMALLARYRFRNPVYQVVFDALRRIRSPHPRTLRQQLQRELVMARFPGLNAADFFQPHRLSYAEAVALLHALVEFKVAEL